MHILERLNTYRVPIDPIYKQTAFTPSAIANAKNNRGSPRRAARQIKKREKREKRSRKDPQSAAPVSRQR